MIDSKEIKKLNADLRKIGKKLLKKTQEIPDSVTRELVIGANDIRNTIILSMRNTPKTGISYRRGKRGKAHIASSPGNPPAIDYGELVRSIMYDVDPGRLEVEVGSEAGAPYAIFLEEGAEYKDGHVMEARPWLAPAVETNEKDIVKRVGDAAFEVIQRGFKT